MSDSKSTNKRIAKNTLVLYFRMLLLMAIGLYTGRINLEALGVTDFGIYNVVGGFVAMFSLISGSLTAACTRFLNYEMGRGTKERLQLVFCSSVTIQYILAAIVVVIAEIIGIWYVNNIMVLPPERVTAANWCFQLSVFNFAMRLITVPYNSAIVAHEKMKTFAYVSIFEAIAKLCICFYVIHTSFDHLIIYAILVFLMSFTVRMVYQIYCKSHFEECNYHFTIDKDQLKEMMGFAGWNLIGSSSGVLKNQGVNMLLNLFFGPTVNAARGVSTQILHAITGFSNNFMMAIKPQITQSYGRGDYGYMISLVNRGSRFSFYILFALGLPLVVNAEYLLHLWLTEVPEHAVIFSQLTLIAAMISAFSSTLITAQLATGNIRNYQIVVGGILMLDFPLVWIAFALGFKPVVALILGIAVEVACLSARILMLPKMIPQFKSVDFIKNVLLRCILVSVSASVFPVLLVNLMSINLGTFILSCTFCFACALLSTIFIGCTKEEKTLLVNLVVKRLNKKRSSI